MCIYTWTFKIRTSIFVVLCSIIRACFGIDTLCTIHVLWDSRHQSAYYLWHALARPFADFFELAMDCAILGFWLTIVSVSFLHEKNHSFHLEHFSFKAIQTSPCFQLTIWYRQCPIWPKWAIHHSVHCILTSNKTMHVQTQMSRYWKAAMVSSTQITKLAQI